MNKGATPLVLFATCAVALLLIVSHESWAQSPADNVTLTGMVSCRQCREVPLGGELHGLERTRRRIHGEEILGDRVDWLDGEQNGEVLDRGGSRGASFRSQKG